MADADPARESDSSAAVARYKTILQKVLDARPSGTRQRIASAIGKNRSFVSQIANPSYATPIPARYLDPIMEICHFSQADRRAFLDAYAEAHPRRLSLADVRPKVRAHTVFLPDFGDQERNRKVDELISDFVLKLRDLIGEPAEQDEGKSAGGTGRKGKGGKS